MVKPSKNFFENFVNWLLTIGQTYDKIDLVETGSTQEGERKMKNLNELPIDVQERIKNTLKAFDEVDVFYEYGKYNFGVTLKSTYGEDHEYIGTYKAKEVYTEEERILNYVNEFQSYPIQYKGKRDYSIFHTGKREVFKMVDGNIEIA